MLDTQLLFLLEAKIIGDQNCALFLHLHNTGKWISFSICSILQLIQETKYIERILK